VNDLINKGFSIDAIAPRILFSFGIGSNYFMEMRSSVLPVYSGLPLSSNTKPQFPESLKMFIHSTTSLWNKTIYDPYVNMLRTTTEGMSAALGNADSITVLPFDQSFRKMMTFREELRGISN